MKTPNLATPMLREFARRLLDYETPKGDPPARRVDAALSVCEKLRGSLSTITGVAGFWSLLARALVLAKAEVPWLGVARVNEDGTLAGLSEADPQLDKEEAARGGAVVIANLIGLLITFVGEALTLSLVREVWPQATFPEEDKQDEQTT